MTNSLSFNIIKVTIFDFPKMRATTL